MKKQLITLAIAAAFAAPALAQSPGRTTADPKDSNPAAPPAKHGVKDQSGAGASASGFSAMDRNNDGYISRDEARDASWQSRFSELDKDNDGRISQSEYGALGSTGAAGATTDKDARSPSTTGGMGGSVGPGGTQSGSSTSGIGDKPGQKQ